jgi:hypothetical protein
VSAQTKHGRVIDLRRCKRCRKIPRGRMQTQNAKRYAPYCSYHCQEWARLEDASAYVRNMPEFLK